MYTPTKEELDELVNCKIFMIDHTEKTCSALIETNGIYIAFCEGETLVLGKFKRWSLHMGGKDKTIYPQSLEDIKTIIRNLTPQ